MANDQKYQTAITEAKSALSAQDYATARAKADVALGIRPKDTEATKLRNEAQGQLDLAIANEQKYQSAIAEAKSALSAQDYAKARTKAEVALGIRPKDAEATKLRDDAQGQLDLAMANDQKYRTAITEVKAALNAQDYAKAKAKAEVALGIRPKDAEATKLRDEAQGQLALAVANDGKYQSAMTEGKAALNAKNYVGAIKQANTALKARPNDPAAKELLAEAQKGRGSSTELDSELKLWEVMFNSPAKGISYNGVVNSGYPLKVSFKKEGSPAERLTAIAKESKDFATKRIESMKDEYRRGGWLDDDPSLGERLNRLVAAIKRW